MILRGRSWSGLFLECFSHVKDTRAAVLSSACATQMGNFMKWDMAYCVYSWARWNECCLIRIIFQRQKRGEELQRWLRRVGSRSEVKTSGKYLLRKGLVNMTNILVVSLGSTGRKLRR